jgi:murein DD-endopeptidase MepM/ murein hydrolase activator NlpD
MIKKIYKKIYEIDKNIHITFDTEYQSEKGVKTLHLLYHLNKKIFLSLFLLFIMIVSIATYIIILNSSLTVIKAKKYEVEEQLLMLQQDISLKELELSNVGKRIIEIESLIGVENTTTSTSNVSLEARSVNLKLTSIEINQWLKEIPNGYPIEYKGVSSSFGKRKDPFSRKKRLHKGIDLRAKRNTPVYATADGVVEYARKHPSSGHGRLIIIDHNHGFKSYFAHLKKFNVKNGAFVRKGDLIAYSGNSGKSSGPHLHYEVRFLHHALNPKYFMQWSVEDFYTIFKKIKYVPWDKLATRIEEDLQMKHSYIKEI